MKLPSHNPILNARRFRLLALENLERAQSAKSVPERRSWTVFEFDFKSSFSNQARPVVILLLK